MVIDIFSLIVGAILWELVRSYMNSVIRPVMDKRRNEKAKKKIPQQQNNAKVQQPNATVN